MKKSTNFSGNRFWQKQNTPEALIALMRSTGMTDEEIKAALLKQKADEQKTAEQKQ